jgi:hypothetical protein
MKCARPGCPKEASPYPRHEGCCGMECCDLREAALDAALKMLRYCIAHLRDAGSFSTKWVADEWVRVSFDDAAIREIIEVRAKEAEK